MSATDKIRNAADNAAGKVKETVGKAKDDQQLEAEGKAEQASADLRQSAEKAKDALK